MTDPLKLFSTSRSMAGAEYYHIFNRGNRKAPIFRCTEDYVTFLDKLHEYALREGVNILAYCLMKNHYHLLLQQCKADGISRLMRSLGISYAKYFNWQHSEVGHLCQDKFKFRAVDNTNDLANLARYIHRNPILIDDPKMFRWSDLAQYRQNVSTTLLEALNMTSEQYLDYVTKK